MNCTTNKGTKWVEMLIGIVVELIVQRGRMLQLCFDESMKGERQNFKVGFSPTDGSDDVFAFRNKT